MKTNSLLTYLLYAVLATLIIAAGYKACQMQKEKQEKAKAQEVWQETLRKMYPESDTSASGSAYISSEQAGQTTTGTKPSVSKDGIEDEVSTPKTTTPGGAATTSKTPATTTTSKTTETTATKPKSTTTTKGGTTVAGAGTGRWEVRAGTFSYMDGARERLEEVIKMGYTNAEIGKTNNGKYAVVIVMRTNDKARAIQVGDQLERRGVDAFVYDRQRK